MATPQSGVGRLEFRGCLLSGLASTAMYLTDATGSSGAGGNDHGDG